MSPSNCSEVVHCGSSNCISLVQVCVGMLRPLGWVRLWGRCSVVQWLCDPQPVSQACLCLGTSSNVLHSPGLFVSLTRAMFSHRIGACFSNLLSSISLVLRLVGSRTVSWLLNFWSGRVGKKCGIQPHCRMCLKGLVWCQKTEQVRKKQARWMKDIKLRNLDWV